MMNNNNPYGRYRTKLFTDIWPDAKSFLDDFTASGLAISNTTNVEVAYYMLYARYGNSHIANLDENQFKYRVFTIFYQYLPTLNKKMDIQDKLRSLELNSDDLFEGARVIYNHSYNPSTAPSTNTTTELETINDQNVTKNRRSKLDGYSFLYGMLEDDLWAKFVDRFKKLFITIVQPGKPLLFENEDSAYD